MTKVSKRHHCFIEAKSLSKDMWAYLYEAGDGAKLNFSDKDYTGQFQDSNGHSYTIISKQKLVAAPTGCYHIWIDDPLNKFDFEILNAVPTFGTATAVCFGTGGCAGNAIDCKSGLIPECNSNVLSCIDPENT